MIKKLLLFSVLLVVSNILYAKEEILGAFGFKFNQILNINEEKKGVVREGGEIYLIKPENNIYPFNDFFAFVTPETKRIYKLIAQGTTDSEDNCNEEQEKLEAILVPKYGENFKDGLLQKLFFASLSGDNEVGVAIKESGRSIITFCSKNNKINIEYTDHLIEGEASKEKIKQSNL